VSSSHTESKVEVTMPQMGVSVADGTILEWRKRPGDWVEADETICEVTTDKVDVEIPSPAAGRLDRIFVEAGENVPVGTPIAEIDGGASAGEAHPDEHHEPDRSDHEPDRSDHEPDRSGHEPDRSGFHSPVARRIAAEHGIDLDDIEGTGIGGRVRKRDVLARIEADRGRPEQERPLHTESPYRPDEPAEPALEPAANGHAAGNGAPGEQLPGRREPLSPMRQAIARHMVSSRRSAAHCTTIVEADMSRVAASRERHRDAMAQRGVTLTYLAYVAHATVEALGRHPILNASIDGDEIVYHDDVNLGIAVALEDGLIVPVIPKAQRLSLEGLAAAIGDLAGRARSGGLEPDDVHGGTFTITNPGQFGAVLATPIINQPQVAILDLEAIVKRPVVVEAGDGTDSIAIRPMAYLPMSWDHRALDGAEAARFLSEIKQRLEGWETES
jgi:pyruvate/2-oxoglutarate dehydrogenase complex dihydrolipoamide acyltransferase (E2) component